MQREREIRGNFVLRTKEKYFYLTQKIANCSLALKQPQGVNKVFFFEQMCHLADTNMHWFRIVKLCWNAAARFDVIDMWSTFNGEND